MSLSNFTLKIIHGGYDLMIFSLQKVRAQPT